MKKSVVIGSGFAGLASASLIAKAGHEVTLVEKNAEVGGRARKFEAEGFMFDMGPSWYWMPDVFERYYNYFGKTASDFYELQKLDPAFRLFFPDQTLDMPGEPDGVYDFFEQLEPGSTEALQSFMKDAAFKYEVGVHDIIYRQPDGLKPFLNWKVMSSAARLQLLKAISKHIASYFDHPYLRQVLEFPVLFLGADPKETPALYSMMDYAGLMLGTWYPQGGMNEIVKAMESIALENGVHIQTENEVLSLTTDKNLCSSLLTKNGSIDADAFVIAGDY
ncbi:MAG: phytoene desaturase family protein, partial [Cyclobacteriaceae bacterium]